MTQEVASALHVVVGRPRVYGADRRAIARGLAAGHDGVVHRLALAEHGIDRFAVRNEVNAGRWFKVGRHTVAVQSPDLSERAQWWRAVWESGSGARLDGASALQAAGMTGFNASMIDVTLPKSSHTHPVERVRLHLPRVPDPVSGAGIRKVASDIASIHAAQWAVSDRQAALLVCLSLQQGLTTPTRILLTWNGIRRSTRRKFLDEVIRDVADGAHSLGELDFTRMARKVGLPTPSHQSLRKGPDGRIYLDISWDDVGLVVEIDGGHHALALNPIDDALRQNDRVAAGERVLRVPVIGLRLETQRFMLQIRHTYDVLLAETRRPGRLLS